MKPQLSSEVITVQTALLASSASEDREAKLPNKFNEKS
jgi:hypothetical protein